MRYITSSLLLAAVVAAAPAQSAKRDSGKSPMPCQEPSRMLIVSSPDVEERAPVADVFAKAFPTFIGRSEEDVAKFISKGEKVTTETSENAAKWKRDAVDAGDDAAYALAVTKRGLYVRRAAAEDEDFWKSENKKADELAKKAMKLKREATESADAAAEASRNYIDVLKRSKERNGPAEETVRRAEEESTVAQMTASNLERDADAAAEEAAESYAVVAYALRARASPWDIETFVKRDQMNAEVAMAQERRVKRESFFANKAARKREALHDKALKLRENFK